MALAYVRSRHYQYEDPPGSGNWESDPTSDLGRISRQQDFLRRVLSSLLDKGPLNPSVARGLIRAGTDYIVTDRELTPAKMMEFAGVMNDVDPAIDHHLPDRGDGQEHQRQLGADPQHRRREHAGGAGALPGPDCRWPTLPVQQFEQTTTAPPRGTTTTVATGDGSGASEPALSSDAAGTDPAGTADTAGTDTAGPIDSAAGGSDATVDSTAEATGSSVASGQPLENQFGIVPPRDVSC